MILLYRVLTIFIYPFLIIFIYYRKTINKEDPIRFKEKILSSHFKVKRNEISKLIWFHAASIGEFKSIVPIIENILSNNKNFEILVTTTTLSSGNLASIEFKKFDKVYHRYFPFDVDFLVKKFLKLWKPNFIFLVDSEIWPNLILVAKKNKIPLALINARLTSKTFQRWMKFPKTAKKIFNAFELCLTSNQETKKYLEKLEARSINFYGNIKLVSKIDEHNIQNSNGKFLQKKRFWVAASTHKGEDLFCMKVHQKIKEKYDDIITIIIPRHINKVRDISRIAKGLNLKTQLLERNQMILENKELIIVNSFGVLQDYFKYAKSVFIGKSVLTKFKAEGGQNPIDAANLNCKIYHGPYVYNFEEIYRMLRQDNITKKIATYEELSENLIKDLTNPIKAKTNTSDYLKNLGQKILKDTMKSINSFLNDIK
tara:strand:- start:1309 stop:2589 length:1281 start_codon:yes stop_codon:yes gene_type:complete